MKSNNAAMKCVSGVFFGLLALFSFPALADKRIAVLEFELNDLTMIPRTPEELERTASVAPLLREALTEKGGYELAVIDPDAQSEADASVGYLFEHPELGAELGGQVEADWIAVGAFTSRVSCLPI